MEASLVTFAAHNQARIKVQPRRAGKACHQCHARKIRCDVQRRGTPCSNCVDQLSTCVVRRRKNARSTSDPVQAVQHPRLSNREIQDQARDALWSDGVRGAILPLATAQPLPPEYHFDEVSHLPQRRDVQGNGDWQESAASDNPIRESAWAPLGGVDLSNLPGLDAFAFPEWALLSSAPPPANGVPTGTNAARNVNVITHKPIMESPKITETHDIGLSTSSVVNAADRQFLQDQGCFQLPPTPLLRQILRYYFQFIHPNLPVVDEYRFEALFTQDDFDLDEFSFLVFRAMLFAAIHVSLHNPNKSLWPATISKVSPKFIDMEDLSVLGFSGKREARLAYYRQAKFMFDFSLEADPLATAQACLLLTYYAPSYNRLRVNAHWLMNAARFARIAQADRFHLVRDALRARMLKRLWWCVLFRDRVLSLGLRWTPQIELNPDFENEEYYLNAEDFELDLGNSAIHDRATQLRLVDIAASTCSLVCKLTPALQLLYCYDNAEERIRCIANAVPKNMLEAQRCLSVLQQWYDRITQTFPEPISMDDTDGSVCIYANLLFCYYSSAVFALNFHRILMHETIPESIDWILMDVCLEASVTAINDLNKRTQELVQTRLTRYLPISVSAYMALPLLLQAITVAAVSGTDLEAVEARKLDIFSRVLKSQEENFDGSRFCTEILSDIVAYVRNDQRFIDWIAAWRDERESSGYSMTADDITKHRSNIKLNWANLIRTQPKLYVRLLLHLDSALCTGSAPKEEELLPALLGDTLQIR